MKIISLNSVDIQKIMIYMSKQANQNKILQGQEDFHIDLNQKIYYLNQDLERKRM